MHCVHTRNHQEPISRQKYLWRGGIFLNLSVSLLIVEKYVSHDHLETTIIIPSMFIGKNITYDTTHLSPNPHFNDIFLLFIIKQNTCLTKQQLWPTSQSAVCLQLMAIKYKIDIKNSLCWSTLAQVFPREELVQPQVLLTTCAERCPAPCFGAAPGSQTDW